MANAKGIDVVQSNQIAVRAAFLQDAAGDLVTTGTTTYRLFEVQDDGTLNSFDFNDNTFKATALTTATLSATHRTGNNGTYNTGTWTAVLSLLRVAGMTVGRTYLEQFENSNATPPIQARKFQYGSAEGDIGDFYWGDIQFVRDQANAKDEWLVAWFKNGERVVSGVTVPRLTVVKRADGTNLINSATMTDVADPGTSGAFRYDEATNRVTVGEGVIARATATIDGFTRTWERVIGRDSA